MFDIEQSISDWRKQMLAAGIKTPVPLEELEIHLREEIEHQLKSDTNAQRAFEVAVQQIGKVNMLKKEFKKVEETKGKCDDKPLQILLLVVSSLIPLLVGSMAFFKIGGFSQLTFGQRMSSLAAMVSFSFLMWCGRFSCKILPVIHAKRIRDAIAISNFGLVMLWWMVFVQIILPRHDFTTGQLQVTVLWEMMIPLGAWAGLMWGIETAARKKVATSD